jgi:hypothetical protein
MTDVELRAMNAVTAKHFAEEQPDLLNPVETIETMIASVDQQARMATDMLYKSQAVLQDAQIRKKRWDVLLEGLRIALNGMELTEHGVPTRTLETTTAGEHPNGHP